MAKIKPLLENEIEFSKKNSIRKKNFLFSTILLLLIIIGLSLTYGNQFRTIFSFTKIGDESLYVMTYYGDYGFDKYLKTGIYPIKSALWARKGAPWACSIFSARNEMGNPLLGRNFDWIHRSAVLLFTHPPKGYRSVSLLDPYYCGFLPPDYTPASLFDRTKLMIAPWVPMDGMNECGLAIGLMSVPDAEGSHNLHKMNINEVDVIRLVLDHAKDVTEAIALIKKYNIVFAHEPIHFLIADVSGHSAVIEFVKSQVEVIQNTEAWQVSTNFQIYGTKDGALLCNRYATATQTLKKTNGVISDDGAMKLLKDVSQPITMWSAVYNLSTGDIQVRMGFNPAHFSQVKKFKLKMKP